MEYNALRVSLLRPQRRAQSSANAEHSQMAHDVHKLMHPFVETAASVCVFHCDGEYVLSFAGYGVNFMLSDWYPLVDDFDSFLKKIDIGNISISSDRDYPNAQPHVSIL